MTEVQTILYKLPEAWGLPSLSVACIQVEAYLRLANIKFAVQQCSAPSACPTGQVPALDTSTDLVGGEVGAAAAAAAAPLAEYAAARVMLDYLKQKVVNLDRGLTASQKAEAAAFGALVEAKLQPALAYSTWCEGEAFGQHTRAAYGAGLPFPLSFLIPRSQRKAMMQHFAGTSSSQVYQGAAEALDALAMRLNSSSGGGDYFFGSQPSSLDALLYGCLAFLRAAPVVHPLLQQKLAAHRVLGTYVERISQLAFEQAAPPAAEAHLAGWSEWAGGAGGSGGDDKYSKAKSERESELQRKGRRWLLCAAGAIAAYIFLSGQYIDLEVLSGYEEEGEDEEDE